MGCRSIVIVVAVAGLFSPLAAAQPLTGTTSVDPSVDSSAADLLTLPVEQVDLHRVREVAAEHSALAGAFLASRRPRYSMRDLLLATEPVIAAYAITQAAADPALHREMSRTVSDIPYAQQPLMMKIVASANRVNGGAGGRELLVGYASQLLREKHIEGFEAMLHYVTVGELAGDDTELPLLHKLIQNRDFENARWLVNKGVRLHAGDTRAGSTLLVVVHADEPAMLNDLLSRRDWPVAVIDDAIVTAAALNRPLMIESLAARGARRDGLSSDGQSALGVAAGRGHPEVARQLLQLGFDPRIKDRDDMDAFDWARALKQSKLLEILHEQRTGAVAE